MRRQTKNQLSHPALQLKLKEFLQSNLRPKFIVLTLVLISSLIGLVHILPAKAQSANSFTFGAAGDFWTGSNFQATLDAVAQENPNFMLALGDLSYTPGYEQDWCNRWKAVYNNITLIVGNHDTGENPGGSIDNYVQYCPFALGRMTGVYGHQYYFDYPAQNPLMRVILIRPGIGGTGPISYNAGKPGYNFTQSAIDGARSQGIPWVVVGFHKNYISMLEKNNEIGTDLMKLLLDKKVDLILQGHEHSYERTKQLTTSSSCPILPTNTYDANCVSDSDNDMVKGAGTVIGVMGTGGVDLRTINPSDPEAPYFAVADNTTFGFGKFTVTADQLSYNFVRSAGGSLSDSFTITASPSATPSPVKTPTPTPKSTPTPTPTRSPSPTPNPGGLSQIKNGTFDGTPVIVQVSSSFAICDSPVTPTNATLLGTGTTPNLYQVQISSGKCKIGTLAPSWLRTGSTGYPARFDVAQGNSDKFQKIIADTSGVGIYQNLLLNPGKKYKIEADIYVEKGSALLKITDQSSNVSQTSNTLLAKTGWQKATINIVNLNLFDDTLLRAVSKANGSVFYVNNVVVTQVL